jgi:CBS domain-containing protein
MRSIIAGDVMTPTILKVSEATTITELANFLIDHEITGAVVTNDDGAPVGVVSSTDITAAAALAGEGLESKASRRGFYSQGWEDTFDENDLVGVHVTNRDIMAGEIMTPELFSVAVDMPVPEVARLMCDAHLHRVLVTADDDFVGIITTSDLLGLLVEEPA